MPIRRTLDRIRPFFEEGGKLELLRPLYVVIDDFFYTTDETTKCAPHVRDSLDLKRMMAVVCVALLPCVFMAMWNTGYQANLAREAMGLGDIPGWRGAVIHGLGFSGDPTGLWGNLTHGALYFLPAYLVCLLVGGAWEVLFGIVRRHEVNEGFFVTGLLFPLTLPPTIPLWQVAIGITFGVVVAKELFGGTGKNFLNPALAARAFLYFAYPAQNSGDRVWTAVDGYSGATALTALGSGDAEMGMQVIEVSWAQAFLGTIPGSMGETSTLACLLGASLLVVTGIGSWRIMLSMLTAGMLTALCFWTIGSESNAMFAMSPLWHLVTGGFAFGLVFMATDPVSATMTESGKWIFGALIGVMTILIRVLNPAYPEGVMFAILLGNVFAPLIDYLVVEAHIKRRRVRIGA